MHRRYAVFGQPIAHSLSPRIHAAFGAQFDLSIDYRAIEASREAFPSALQRFADAGGVGANVTLPLKQDALALCRAVSARARRCGSVNTLVRDGDAWRGDSTDGVGLLRDLERRHAFAPSGASCVLLGAGGAARAVAFALAEAGVRSLAICNRTAERAKVLVEDIGDDERVCAFDGNEAARAAPFDLVVNATSAGHSGATLWLADGIVSPRTLCYDLSYGHAAQAFVTWARTRGAKATDGLGMLVEQAAESFAIWHGQTPETDAVYATLRDGA